MRLWSSQGPEPRPGVRAAWLCSVGRVSYLSVCHGQSVRLLVQGGALGREVAVSVARAVPVLVVAGEVAAPGQAGPPVGVLGVVEGDAVHAHDVGL